MVFYCQFSNSNSIRFKFLNIDINLSINNILFVLVSLSSQIGDICISYFKRKSKIKDTGKLIPGHGGLLDRIDGIIFAIPMAYFIILNNLIFYEKENCNTWFNWFYR